MVTTNRTHEKNRCKSLCLLVALMEQSSNQILMDMKNIYEFRDIIEVLMNSSDIYQEIIDNNP